MDLSHLHAIELRLASEKGRLGLATNPDEIALRTVWVSQTEDELARERAFLGLPPENLDEVSLDDIFAEMAELGL